MQGRRRVNNAARNAGYSVGTANGKSHSRVMTNQIFNRMREKERIESLKSSAMTQNVEDHRRMAANLASEERSAIISQITRKPPAFLVDAIHLMYHTVRNITGWNACGGREGFSREMPR